MKAMLGLLTPPSPPLTITSNLTTNNSIRVTSNILPVKTLNQFHLKSQKSRNNFTRFLVFAAENDNGNNGENIDNDFLMSNDEKKQQSNGDKGLNGNGNGINSNNSSENGNRNGNGQPRLNLRWIDLLIDPDPDNVVAVGLTGVLAWASVQVLWQLFVISIAIILAALKYSFIAALLIFILIALL